ncbi:uncharacterized protein AMSG_10605 [Thecamonas trahens ATCC 50062]|uniref:Amino acid permease n=1 Tax=Thecamonas trahens ATCC 50062 TaxID=461836 RepID=A0A0L0DRQ6_THETB|nr:hypothetical protein AMSG_10605 [Thecamonas trahens ATCC 50062]KNC55014.1 hypothetical protein AMSG_10605 [Thecamonas trahens ATCC 50062]|eukprot:XP_013753325.1 hypothetical protein AMSG_10605 [Thecamonas trahens ATCC 50062]
MEKALMLARTRSGAVMAQSGSGGDAEAATGGMARTIRWYHLLLLCFFWTCGGPFGIEPAVGAAGPLVTMLGLISVGIFWGLPQALISAELAVMIPDNGGNFKWVQRAFGPAASALNGYNNMVMALISNALLIQLVVQYLPTSVELNFAQGAWLMAGFVALCLAINLYRPTAVAELNLIILPLLFVPFVAIAVYAYHTGAGESSGIRKSLTTIPPVSEINWSVFLSTILWAADGYDSSGSAAGEIVGGKRAFLLGVIGSIPITLVNYAIPIMLSYSIAPSLATWNQGGFVNVGYAVSRGCGVVMVVTSLASVFGQLNSALVPNARVVWATALADDPRHRLLPRLLSYSYRSRSGVVRPLVAIMATALAALVVALAPFQIVVESYLYFRLVNLGFEYASLIALRINEPETPREMRIPGGLLVCFVFCLPLLGVAGILLATSTTEAMAVGIGAQFVFAGAYAVRWHQARAMRSAAEARPLLGK